METLRRTLNQYTGLYNSMSPSQRATLVLVPVIVVAAFGFLLFTGRSSSDVALSWGKVFTSAEIMNAEQTLQDAGLNDFRRNGLRIMVPAGDVERYNAALLEGGSLPINWAEELEKQFEGNGIFNDSRKSQNRKDVALGKALSRILRAVSDIKDGSVIWARSKPQGWRGRGAKVTATVNVMPRRGRQLSMRLVHSLQAAVANMVPDLKSADVIVFDQSTGVSHTPDKEGDPYSSRLLTRIKEFEDRYQSKVSEALSYIPKVLVTVDVELDNLKSSVEQIQTVDPKKVVAIQQTSQSRTENYRQQPARAEPGVQSNRGRDLQAGAGNEKSRSIQSENSASVSLASRTMQHNTYSGGLPKSVQVSVQIPEDYYQAVEAKQSASSDNSTETQSQNPNANSTTIKTREDIEKDVKATVRRAIGTLATEDSITVTSYVQVDRKIEELEVSLTDTVSSALSQWGGAVGLALFALWALWMLNKSMAKLPAEEVVQPAGMALHAMDDEETDEEPAPAEPTRRDELQDVVRDNPEMAAAVLRKWVQTAQ